MIKRFTARLLAIAAAAVLLASCGGKDIGKKAESADEPANSASETESEQQDSADTSEPEEAEESRAPLYDGELKAPAAEEKIDLSQGATENMLIRSVYDRGDTRRLAQKLKAARELADNTGLSSSERYGLATKIAFFGDSVTTGYNASGDKKFASLFQSWWEKNYSFYADWNISAIVGTDSYIGVHRAESDMLYDEPDIIFIEFINDENTEFYKESMDSLLRKCLSMPNKPAVILIETMWADGSSPQGVHSELALEYGVPVLSFRDAVLPEIDAGALKWEDVFADNVHPNDTGHELIAQMLISYCDSVADEMYSLGEPEAFKAQSPTGDKYKNAAILDAYTDLVWENNGFHNGSQLRNFQNGWGTITGGDITFAIECKNLGLLYTMAAADGGVAEIIVDNEVIANIDADYSEGTADYAASAELFSGSKSEFHLITITVPQGKRFEVLRWLIS